MVYFIFATNAKKIKIGKANDVEDRLRMFQTGSPDILICIKSVKGDYEEESKYHEMFADLREHGEWFKADPRLLGFIHSLPSEGFTGQANLVAKNKKQRGRPRGNPVVTKIDQNVQQSNSLPKRRRGRPFKYTSDNPRPIKPVRVKVVKEKVIRLPRRHLILPTGNGKFITLVEPLRHLPPDVRRKRLINELYKKLHLFDFMDAMNNITLFDNFDNFSTLDESAGIRLVSLSEEDQCPTNNPNSQNATY